MAFGATVDEIAYDTSMLPNLNNPFVLWLSDEGQIKKIRLNTEEGALLLDNPGVASVMLRIMMDHGFVRKLESLADHMMHYEDPDISHDDWEAYGFDKYSAQELQFATDGTGIAIWNKACNIDRFAFDDEDQDDDHENDQELDDLVKLILPPAASSHEDIQLAPTVRGLTDIVNSIALGEDSQVTLTPAICQTD